MAFENQKLATVVALEVAKNSGWFKRGSKDYFSTQINGHMKSGNTYGFILPDSGNVVHGQGNLTASPSTINEHKVELTIDNYINAVETSALDEVINIGNWEEEVGSRFAARLVNEALQDYVAKDSKKANTAFVGAGFIPMAKAGAYLQSITTENLVGFVDPQVQAVLAANGQQFMPCGAPGDLYGKGHLGIFQNVDYSAERFLKPVVITETEKTAIEAATASESNGVITIALTGSVKAGTPLFIEGCKACDSLGMATDADWVYIVKEDTIGNIVIDLADEDIMSADGAKAVDFVAGFSGAAVKTVDEAGTYRMAYIRADKSYNFSEVKDLDVKLSDKGSVGDVDGIRVAVNSFTDGITAKNTTRFDWLFMAGTVDQRLVSVAYIKC